jgi:hypothetical protein
MMMLRDWKRRKKENHAGASPWGAHVYQIACPNRWGGLYEGKNVLERLSWWLCTGEAVLLRLVVLNEGWRSLQHRCEHSLDQGRRY